MCILWNARFAKGRNVGEEVLEYLAEHFCQQWMCRTQRALFTLDATRTGNSWMCIFCARQHVIEQ